MTTITLPLTQRQATAIVVVADAFCVEPWELAVHVLATRPTWPPTTKGKR